MRKVRSLTGFNQNSTNFVVTKPQPLSAMLQEEAAADIEDDLSTQYSQESEELNEEQDDQLGENQDQPDCEYYRM